MFNVGEYRRATTQDYRDHGFFDPGNKEAMQIRRWDLYNFLPSNLLVRWLLHLFSSFFFCAHERSLMQSYLLPTLSNWKCQMGWLACYFSEVFDEGTSYIHSNFLLIFVAWILIEIKFKTRAKGAATLLEQIKCFCVPLAILANCIINGSIVRQGAYTTDYTGEVICDLHSLLKL